MNSAAIAVDWIRWVNKFMVQQLLWIRGRVSIDSAAIAVGGSIEFAAIGAGGTSSSAASAVDDNHKVDTLTHLVQSTAISAEPIHLPSLIHSNCCTIC